MSGPLINAKHERFAQEVASGRSASEAYANAGFRPSRPNASHLQRNHNVAQRIAELIEQQHKIEREATKIAAAELSIDRKWVMSKLVENVERAMQERAVTDSEGNPTGEYKYDGGVANRALELLGKELSMFVDRSETVNTHHIVSDDLPTAAQWEAEHAEPHADRTAH